MEALRDMVVAGTLYGWACTASGETTPVSMARVIKDSFMFLS
jgi:hypothetical protein